MTTPVRDWLADILNEFGNDSADGPASSLTAKWDAQTKGAHVTYLRSPDGVVVRGAAGVDGVEAIGIKDYQL